MGEVPVRPWPEPVGQVVAVPWPVMVAAEDVFRLGISEYQIRNGAEVPDAVKELHRLATSRRRGEAADTTSRNPTGTAHATIDANEITYPWSVNEAARVLSVSDSYIRRECRNGALVARKNRQGKWRIAAF